jgi:hypothetical protein
MLEIWLKIPIFWIALPKLLVFGLPGSLIQFLDIFSNSSFLAGQAVQSITLAKTCSCFFQGL